MAKISKTIVAIKAELQKGGIMPLSGQRTTKSTTRYLLALFETLRDPRQIWKICYPLEYILLIAFLAVLGGANTWQEIQDFGESMSQWLSKFLDVKKYGIPSHDTFCRVFGLLDTSHLQDMIVNLLTENLSIIKRNLHIEPEPDEYRYLHIDGKEENGTGRKYSQKAEGKVRNTQTLHIYDGSNGICLASEAIDQKTNEIPVAQKLLRSMDLTGAVCTFDALHMQKDTITIISSKQGHYVGGLKGNQQGLMEESAACFTDEVCLKLKKSRKKNKPVYVVTEEHAHSQMETREFFLVSAPENKERDEKWSGLCSYVCCKKTIMPDNPALEATTEVRYYASDLDDLAIISDAIRAHWAVEQFHWQLDVSFQQDDNSTMNVKAFENLALLNKMALHLLQLMKLVEKNVSIKRLRKRFGWNYESNMETLLSLLDEQAIINTLGERK